MPLLKLWAGSLVMLAAVSLPHYSIVFCVAAGAPAATGGFPR